MFIVREYAIQFQIYHNEIVGRLIFKNEKGEQEESNLYSLSEIENIVSLWQAGCLQGSFGIGSMLERGIMPRLCQ